MEVRSLIGQITQKEPLNPYQIAGMAAVLIRSGARIAEARVLHVEQMPTVLMVLDRTGEEASSFLVDVRCTDATAVLFPRFPRETLEQVSALTSLPGRRQAILDNLVPVLYEIPNWLDLVRTLIRYSLERDDRSLGDQLPVVMDILFAFLFAASRQPFDAQARSEAEYAIARLVENVLKQADDTSIVAYLPFVERALDFLCTQLFPSLSNPLERRVVEVFGIRSALNKRRPDVKDRLSPLLDKMAAQALITAVGEVKPCPAEKLERLERVVCELDFPDKEEFRREILDRIRGHSVEEIEKRRQLCLKVLQGTVDADERGIQSGIEFLRSLGDQWKRILRAFEQRVDALPLEVQEAFSEILAFQILALENPDVKHVLIEGLCRIVIRLEKSAKQASRNLVNGFTTLFLDRAFATEDVNEAVSALKAVESLGVTLGRNGYFLMAREFVNHLVQRPLMRPKEKKYTIEDDDTGEPLVLAEETSENLAHVQHIKSLLAIIASNVRIMRRLIPYLVIQMELGGTRLCDEDLIQYWLSSLLRGNSSVIHFMVRTLIKAIPYSLKDIGPLDNLRLTAAGLAKELANRGVKPIGNFLGKLRGDIHWRGSIENFYFCQGIMAYMATGEPEAIAEWMPRDSMPYLRMDQWCSAEEAKGIRDLCGRILVDYRIDLGSKEDLNRLMLTDTSRYRNDDAWPQFSRKVVLDIVELLKGLHRKYFIVAGSAEGATVKDDLERLERIIAERRATKENLLTPDISDPMPQPVTLTEGSEEQALEMDRIRREEPATPIILRAKKAGHAYAQKAEYIEQRFEAFNRDLQLEALQETLATSISNSHFDEITGDNLPDALCFLDYLVQGMDANGHSSIYLKQAGKDLRNAGALGLTFDKVRDILKTIEKELDDIHDYYRFWFEEPFDVRIAQSGVEKLPRKLRDLTTLKDVPDTDFFHNYLKTLYISDLQARDGNLRVLEGFIDKVELFLNQRLAESGRRVDSGIALAAEAAPFYFPEHGEMTACRIGLKAALLRFAENTPPYFVIPTAHALKNKEEICSDPEFRKELTSSVKVLEKRCGRTFGDPSNPALFSVRSGARISMPGMMITITNVGINDRTAAALAHDRGVWFAYDCYRRFLQEFGQSVFGVGREEFQDIIDERKTRWRVQYKAKMSAEQMKQLAFDYKNRLKELAPEAIEMLDKGHFIDVLSHCAAAVLHSYETPAAVKYRKAAGIDGVWRTPVIVQVMVYGNLDFHSSGTGVMSYNPFTMETRGDFAYGDQGTDVVGGKVATIPVYDLWKEQETLASRMPDVWKKLSSAVIRAAESLHFHANAEYTIENGQVFILQIRKNRERAEVAPSLESFGYKVIAKGTGVSGKIFRGIMVTDRNQIAPFRHINKAQSIVDAINKKLPENEKLDGFDFVVNDPIPEEIMEGVFSLPVNTALVSRLGGRGAHAADIAKSLGKVYVGQVGRLVKFPGRSESVRINDVDIVVGSKMIIHGQTGEIALYG